MPLGFPYNFLGTFFLTSDFGYLGIYCKLYIVHIWLFDYSDHNQTINSNNSSLFPEYFPFISIHLNRRKIHFGICCVLNANFRWTQKE